MLSECEDHRKTSSQNIQHKSDQVFVPAGISVTFCSLGGGKFSVLGRLLAKILRCLGRVRISCGQGLMEVPIRRSVCGMH